MSPPSPETMPLRSGSMTPTTACWARRSSPIMRMAAGRKWSATALPTPMTMRIPEMAVMSPISTIRTAASPRSLPTTNREILWRTPNMPETSPRSRSTDMIHWATRLMAPCGGSDAAATMPTSMTHTAITPACGYTLPTPMRPAQCRSTLTSPVMSRAA